MVWKHIFWNDDFIVSNKDDWVNDIAGKVFSKIQFEVHCTMENDKQWPYFYCSVWDIKLKHIFLEILNIVKKGAGDGFSACRNSPKIYSIIIAKENEPQISIMGYDENKNPILEISQYSEEIEFFSDISHMV